MKEKNAPSLKHPEIFFLSLFGTGQLPWGPGTLGSLVALPLAYFLASAAFPLPIKALLVVMATILVCIVTHRAQKKFSFKDPSWLVADEGLGVLVGCLFISSSHFLPWAIFFGLFRLFDIVKPWPANYFDKKMQHSAGIILDDIVSGLYAGLCCHWIYQLNFL